MTADPDAGPQWEGTARYKPGSDGVLRPYLWLEVTGPGGDAIPINGLIDTGADTSVLPLPYARLLGYRSDELEPEHVRQVDGSVEAWIPMEPCRATIPGAPPHEFELRPLLVAGALNALWGRADFLRNFQLGLADAEESFTLVLP